MRTVAQYLAPSVLASRAGWGKKLAWMDREHAKHLKKKKRFLKSKSLMLWKVKKKLKKKRTDQALKKEKEDLSLAYKSELSMLCQHERWCVKKIESHQGSFLSQIADSLDPLLTEELAMCSKGEQLEELLKKSHGKVNDPSNTEENFLGTCNELFWFTSPISTPNCSLIGSRTNSLSSVNTFSRTSSVSSLDSGEYVSERVSQYRE